MIQNPKKEIARVSLLEHEESEPYCAYIFYDDHSFQTKMVDKSETGSWRVDDKARTVLVEGCGFGGKNSLFPFDVSGSIYKEIMRFMIEEELLGD